MTVRGVTSSFADSNAPLHWRQRQELSGYNIMTMGIWYEAAMRWVGPVERVFARGRVFTRSITRLRREPWVPWMYRTISI